MKKIILLFMFATACSTHIVSGRIVGAKQVADNRQAVLVRVGNSCEWYYLPLGFSARWNDSVRGTPRRINTGDPLRVLENCVITK